MGNVIGCLVVWCVYVITKIWLDTFPIKKGVRCDNHMILPYGRSSEIKGMSPHPPMKQVEITNPGP